MNIKTHPVWNNITPWKKRGHLARLYLAKQYARFVPARNVIGVVGSVGKTTTTLAIKKVLSEKYNVVATSDNNPNLDPIFNLPMTILRTRPKTDRLVLEFGIEFPGEMDFYLSIIKPKTLVVTKLSYEHGEFLGDLENIIKEECRGLEELDKNGLAILNWDDLNTRKSAEKTRGQILYYGTDPKNCEIWAGNIKIVDFKTTFELNYGVERVEVSTKLLGFHQIYPLLAAAAVGVSNDVPLVLIRKGLEKMVPVEHRMQVLAGLNGSTVLDDTYNAQPAAVEEALETLNQVSARRRIVVLGEMRELGKMTEKFHREIARKIYKDKLDIVLLGSGNAEIVADELKNLGFDSKRLFPNLTNEEIINKLQKILLKGDVVLVKGARAVKLEEVVDKITK